MARENTWRARAEKVVNRVSEVFPSPEFENWGLCEELILSAEFACEQINFFEIETENTLLLLERTGFYFYYKGKYVQTEPLFQKRLEITKKSYG